jgi:hypothetical protein
MGARNIVTAIECRDRKARVDSPQIEAFAEKCRDTGIDKGVIVSSAGFTKPAIAKAAAKQIDCITLSEAASFPWNALQGIFVSNKRIDAIVVEVRIENFLDQHYDLELQLADSEPTLVSEKEIGHTLTGLFEQIPLDNLDAQGGVTKIILNEPAELVAIAPDGSRQRVLEVTAEFHYSFQESLHPVYLYRYRREDNAQEFQSVVSEALPLKDGLWGKVVGIQELDGSVRGWLITSSTPDFDELPSLPS